MSNTRWQIWGRYAEGRETFLNDVLVHDNRNDELGTLAEEFGPRWYLWLEGFPVEHPHAALRRRLLSGEDKPKLGRPRSADFDDDEPEDEDQEEESPPSAVVTRENELSAPGSLMP